MAKKLYTVAVAEVHIQHIDIRADNEEEAMDFVSHGEGEEVNSDFSHTMDRDMWDVEEIFKNNYQVTIDNGTTTKTTFVVNANSKKHVKELYKGITICNITFLKKNY